MYSMFICIEKLIIFCGGDSVVGNKFMMLIIASVALTESQDCAVIWDLKISGGR